QSHALLRAQLIEESVEVEAHKAVSELGTAPVVPHPEAQFPRLLIADISLSDDPQADLECLSRWAKCIPIWVIAAPSMRPDAALIRHGFEAILFRPVDMAELVEKVKQRLGSSKEES